MAEEYCKEKVRGLNEDVSKLDKAVRTIDKDLNTLSSSMQVLATNVGETNSKLDDVIKVIQKQNVLSERMTNMDKEVKEFADRVHSRIDMIELQQTEKGCPMLHLEALKVMGIKDSIKPLKTKTDTIVSATVIRWAVGGLLLGALTLLSFIGVQKGIIKDDIHRIDKIVTKHDGIERRLIAIERLIEGE